MLHWSRLLMKILAANRNLAIAQDIAVDVAELSQRIRSLLETMRDPKRCQLIVVLLAEPLPDRETQRLLAELKSLRLPVRATFTNRVHFSAQSRCPRCASAARWQQATLGRLVSQTKTTQVFAVPEFQQEIAGKIGLATLTKDLWRVQAAKPKRR
jgi:anion-transporting  ArsA/GET3 family ATPase